MVSATRSAVSAMRSASRVVAVASANIANIGTSAKPEDVEVQAIPTGRQMSRRDAQPDSGGYVPVRVEQQSLEGGGVRATIGAIVPSHLLVMDPADPLADDDGIVARPNVDIEGELVAVMRARRAYELSLKVIETEDEMMGSLLDNPI